MQRKELEFRPYLNSADFYTENTLKSKVSLFQEGILAVKLPKELELGMVTCPEISALRKLRQENWHEF